VLNVHYGNRLEALAAELAALTHSPLAAPLTPEMIVVQSRGVARWLALALARQSGICANVEFPFPAGFAWRLYRALGPLPDASPFEPEILAWRILQLLPGCEARPEFAPVRAYVRGDVFRRHELAVRLAQRFADYLIYRPDWIEQWEAGDTPHWQSLLWRGVVEATGSAHRAALHRRFLACVDGELIARAGVPERLAVFGAPALPPMLLELFTALARHIDVHLFILNPCREYWSDIATAADIARKELAARPDAAYLETGNGLLASFGKQGGEFIDLLQNLSGREHEHYVPPGDGDLLSAIQGDILDLREPAACGGPLAVGADDCSVQIHVCHSAMREVEVLLDQLLAIFEAHPGLQPSDVVVMTPDIETYAPYIEAVFDTTEPAVPFNISDRSAERESRLAATFLALLDLPGSRYEASALLAILDEPAVQRRFALTPQDLDTVHAWVRESGIRWGIDAAHRARFGVPPTPEHSWRFGLDRLLLGYALPGAGERLLGDILPYDDVEGSLGAILGRFAEFAEAAIALDDLPGSATVAQWMQRLRALLADFFETDDSREMETEGLRGAIARLEREALSGGFEGGIPLNVVKRALRARLEIPGRAFLSGGVTFCAMVPMRSLPFEVVCLIGLNDGAFPRVQRPYGFDLMVGDFRKGDRSRREDDRYLFLESLLSARRCFYVSYTGQHIRDNSVLPPSVAASELLDYLARNYAGPKGCDIRDHVVTRHPLQPFSRRYFAGDPRLFSYSRTLCEAAALAGRGATAPQRFIAEPLPEPDAEWRTVELDALIRFYRNPARYFLRERLAIRLEDEDAAADAREPFTSTGLEAHALKQRLLALRLRGETLALSLPLARASGLLPHGEVGATIFDETLVDVDGFAERLLGVLPAVAPEPVPLDVELGGMRLRGALGGVSPLGLIGYRFAACKPKDLLEAWIRHLALNVLERGDVERRTRWFLQDKTLTFVPLAAARAQLEQLLALYWAGLMRPLPLFPESALACVTKEAGLNAARNVWHSNHGRGEGDDPYLRLAFRDCDPLDAEFETLAVAVFGPLTAAMTEERAA
jgi:exodeoxyribonuclease V gamma subunit